MRSRPCRLVTPAVLAALALALFAAGGASAATNGPARSPSGEQIASYSNREGGSTIYAQAPGFTPEAAAPDPQEVVSKLLGGAPLQIAKQLRSAHPKGISLAPPAGSWCAPAGVVACWPAGRWKVAAFVVTSGRARRVTLFSLGESFNVPLTSRFVFRLTSAGRGYLAQHRRVHATLQVSYAEPGRGSATASRALRVGRGRHAHRR